MPEPDFAELYRHLLNSGVSPAFVRRTIDELRDHYDDLKQENVLNGVPDHEAGFIASNQLGKLNVIAAQVESRAELRRWSYRYPSMGRLALPILYVAALPMVPIVASVNHAHTFVRWGAILILSALITASLFLAMQVSISLG